MKRYVKAATSKELIVSADGNFYLAENSGIGVKNTPWSGLEVVSEGLAKKHVVEIRLSEAGYPRFEGHPIEFMYKGAYIAHGMRSVVDTLEDTAEYIGVLQEALEFVPEIIAYMKTNGYWYNRT